MVQSLVLNSSHVSRPHEELAYLIICQIISAIVMNDVRFSRVIDGMRFPLIYLVVVAHLIPFTVQEVTFPATGNELYVLISELFSHHISKCRDFF